MAPDPPWTIARAYEPELDEIAALEAASFTHPWSREMLANQLRESDVTRMYVLRTGGRITAFCLCWLILDELHINTVAVDPASRRRGAATHLLGHVLGEAEADGARRATLEVRRSNDAALRLYKRLGFEVTAVRPNYYSEPVEDALIMWRVDLGTPAPDGRGG